MKTKTLLCTIAVSTAMSLTAATPNQVEWNILTNPLTEGTLPQTASGSMIWGDYNNDDNLDLFVIAGQSSSPTVGLFKNNGNGTFTEVMLNEVLGLAWAGATFIDYNNDGNLDLVVAGSMDATSSAAVTILYKNMGAPNYTFEEDMDQILQGVSPESQDNGTRILTAFDYDNDGWTDLLINGNAGGLWNETDSRAVILYRNNKGTFELQDKIVDGANFRQVNGGSVHAGDVNNDGYADIIVTGYSDETDVKTITDLYINNGVGGFTKNATTFVGHQQGETFFADINSDGWQDILEIGRDVNNSWANFAKLYINNKDLTFTKLDEAITGLFGGQAVCAAGDINNDGRIDLFVSGWGVNSTLFYNNGDSTFTSISIPDVTRARSGSLSFVDFNNDNNLDYSIFGYRDGGEGTAENPTWPDAVVENNLGNGITANAAPTIPSNLSLNFADGKYRFAWDKATDAITPQDAIQYNVAIKYSDGTYNCYVPANITTGRLKVANLLPLLSANSIELNLPQNEYEFGVQAVDQAGVASAFAFINSSQLGVSESAAVNVDIYANGNSITIANAVEGSDYTIYNLTGVVLKNGCLSANETIRITDLQAGVYMVKILEGKNSQSIKVVVF